MPPPYSMELRVRVLADCDGGMAAKAAASKYSVSPAWVRRLLQRRRQTGETAPRPRRYGPVPLSQTHGDVLRQAVADQPDAALAELRLKLGLTVALSTLCKALNDLRLTFKKKTPRAAEQDRADVQQARRLLEAAQPLLRPERLVFLDESGASTNMDRRYGRCPEGERLAGKVPHGHWKVTTLVAAMRLSGMQAAMTVDGALNGDLFVAYAEQVLAPTLSPGDVVILDNLSAHQRAEARQAIEARGAALVFLPPYSPDFNPIEMAFSKLKSILRKAKERTVEGLRAAIFAALDDFTPEECANFLHAAGYLATQTTKPL